MITFIITIIITTTINITVNITINITIITTASSTLAWPTTRLWVLLSTLLARSSCLPRRTLSAIYFE
jgi:hypothetical protein